MPAFDSASRNATPESVMAPPATPAFKLDEEAEPDATVQKNHVQVFEEMAVARMLTGAAAAAPVSSADIIYTDSLSARLISKKNSRHSSPRKRTAVVLPMPS